MDAPLLIEKNVARHLHYFHQLIVIENHVRKNRNILVRSLKLTMLVINMTRMQWRNQGGGKWAIAHFI
jgi:hypothetical protein